MKCSIEDDTPSLNQPTAHRPPPTAHKHLLQRELAEPFVELDINGRWSDACYKEFEHLFWSLPGETGEPAHVDRCPSGFGTAPDWVTSMSYDARRSFIQAVRVQETKAELERSVQEDHGIDNEAAREGIAWARAAPRELTSPFEGEAVYQVISTTTATTAVITAATTTTTTTTATTTAATTTTAANAANAAAANST